MITGSGSLELSIQGSLVGALHEELKYFAPYPSGWWESNVRKASRVIATIAVQRTQADGLDEPHRASGKAASAPSTGLEHAYDRMAMKRCDRRRSTALVPGASPAVSRRK